MRGLAVKIYHPAMPQRVAASIAVLIVLAGVSAAGAQPAASNLLFYGHPAREWNQALPLGNGRLGAMVFGNVTGERIQLNENTLWMGGPRETNNPEALAHLAEVRRLLFAGMPVEAYTVAEKYSMGQPFRLESYQALGDLVSHRARRHADPTPPGARYRQRWRPSGYRFGDVR